MARCNGNASHYWLASIAVRIVFFNIYIQGYQLQAELRFAMTKKDYELIAAGIRTVVDANNISGNHSVYTIEAIANTLALVLGAQNPRFNHIKFLTACGVKE